MISSSVHPAPQQLFFLPGRLGMVTDLMTSPRGMTTLGAATDHSGTAFVGLGDINGDGFGDLLVGADAAMASGRAYLVSGGASGLGASATVTFMSPDTMSTRYGHALAWLHTRMRRAPAL